MAYACVIHAPCPAEALATAVGKVTYQPERGKKLRATDAYCMAEAVRRNALLTDLCMRRFCWGVPGIQCLAGVLRTNTTLVHLSIQHAALTAEAVLCLCTALHGNRTLRTLDLHDNGARGRGGKAVAALVAANTALRVLDMSNNDMPRPAMRSLALALAGNTHLLSLNVSYNAAVGKRSGEGKCFGEALKKNTVLQALRIAANGFSASDVCALLTGLKENETLTALDLSSNTVGQDGQELLADLLTFHDHIVWLGLDATAVGPACEFLHALAAARTLSHVSLSHNSLGQEGAKRIARVLQTSPTLQRLDLTHTRLGYEGMQQVLHALAQNTYLYSLHLSVREDGYDTMNFIAEAMQCNRTLLKLRLHRVPPATIYLGCMLHGNRTLRSLYVLQTNLEQVACEALAEALQENTVLTYLHLGLDGRDLANRRPVDSRAPAVQQIEACIARNRCMRVNTHRLMNAAAAAVVRHHVSWEHEDGLPLCVTRHILAMQEFLLEKS